MKKVFLIAAGESKFGDRVKLGYEELFAEAFIEAISKLENFDPKKDIKEGFIGSLAFGGSQLGNMSALIADSVNLIGKPFARVENACGASGFAFRYACYSIMSGMNDVVLAGGVEKMLDISKATRLYWFGVAGDIKWERLSGMTFPGNYALMATRHMHEYGTTRAQITGTAVKNHKNASKNPKAQFRNLINLDKALKASFVAYPLTMFDCCPLTDGGSCAILANEELAKKFTDTPIEVIGMGAGTDHLALYQRESLTKIDAAITASKQAFNMAKIEPKDVDVAEVHDCFTIAEILAYEDIGFCKKGDGGKMIEEGITEVGGKIPVNTGGGLKAKGHPIGATGTAQIYEIFKQLRSEHENQVDGATIGLTHNVGGTGSACSVHIFKRT
ncbi:MAG: thiolase domain-containing protein [Candidatus Lokiarchaeota archaeon]|nr:thiolase domain-containing protein [Candidatus Lokiarchaeota archaeon]